MLDLIMLYISMLYLVMVCSTMLYVIIAHLKIPYLIIYEHKNLFGDALFDFGLSEYALLNYTLFVAYSIMAKLFSIQPFLFDYPWFNYALFD